MKLRNRIAVMLTLGGVAFGAMSLHQRPARAQIDPMRTSYGVYESRPGTTPVLLGEIYREGRDVTRYTEHWVLYPGFVNPFGNDDVTLEIRPGLREYPRRGELLRQGAVHARLPLRARQLSRAPKSAPSPAESREGDPHTMRRKTTIPSSSRSRSSASSRTQPHG